MAKVFKVYIFTIPGLQICFSVKAISKCKYLNLQIYRIPRNFYKSKILVFLIVTHIEPFFISSIRLHVDPTLEPLLTEFHGSHAVFPRWTPHWNILLTSFVGPMRFSPGFSHVGPTLEPASCGLHGSHAAFTWFFLCGSHTGTFSSWVLYCFPTWIPYENPHPHWIFMGSMWLPYLKFFVE